MGKYIDLKRIKRDIEGINTLKNYFTVSGFQNDEVDKLVFLYDEVYKQSAIINSLLESEFNKHQDIESEAIKEMKLLKQETEKAEYESIKTELIGKIQSSIKQDLQELMSSGYDVSWIKKEFKKIVKQASKVATDLNQQKEDFLKKEAGDENFLYKLSTSENGNLNIEVHVDSVDNFMKLLK